MISFGSRILLLASLFAVLGAAKATAQSVSSVTLSPASVTGGATSHALVKLSAKAPTGGLTVSLSSSSTAAVVPASVKLAAGALSTEVTVTTSAVTSQTSAKITAKANGSSASGSLTIAAPILTGLSISPTSVASGTTATGTVTLSGIAPSAGFKVYLKSSSSLVTVASSTTLAAGSAKSAFPISTSFTTTTITATITATAGSHSYTATLTVTPGSPMAASPWPKYNADFASDGRSSASSGANGALAWKLDFYPGPYENAVVGPEGNTYVTNGPDIIAFSPEAKPLWRYLIPVPAATSPTPFRTASMPNLTVGPDGTLYAAYGLLSVSSTMESAVLIAMKSDGSVKWRTTTAAAQYVYSNAWPAPVVATNGNIYLSTQNGLTVINPAGGLVWTFNAKQSCTSPPGFAANGTAFVAMYSPDGTSANCRLYAVTTSGVEKWSVPLQFTSQSPGVGPDGTVYVGDDGASKLYAFTSAGVSKWSIAYQERLVAPVVAASNGNVFVWDQVQLRVLGSDGSLKWKLTEVAAGGSPLSVAADGTVTAIANPNRLYRFSATGVKQWTVSPGTTGTIEGFSVATNGTCSLLVSPLNQGSIDNANGAFGSGLASAIEIFGTSGHESAHFLGDAPNDAPVIGSDGTLYVGGCGGNFYAVSSAGALLWTLPLGAAIYSSPLVGWDDTVYVDCADGKLYAITSKGTIKWSFATGGAMLGAPAMGADGTIYIGSGDGNVYGVSEAGKQVWATNLGTPASTTPAVGKDGTIYVTAESGASGKLYALKPDGTLKWSNPIGEWGAPAVGPDGNIYTAGESDGVSSVSANGQTNWHCAFGGGGGWMVGMAVQSDNEVVFNYDSVVLMWADPANGNIIGQYPAVGTYWTNRCAMATDGTIFYGGTWDLYKIGAGGGSSWTLTLTDGYSALLSPVLGTSMVYVLSDMGRLYAVR